MGADAKHLIVVMAMVLPLFLAAEEERAAGDRRSSSEEVAASMVCGLFLCCFVSSTRNGMVVPRYLLLSLSLW
jgi:hypothetical protein